MGNYGSGGANFTPDDKTLDLNSSQEAQVKPSTTTQTTNLSDITYSSNTTLAGDIYAKNVTIDSGVTITTNGFNFYCSGTFTNNGTITTGTNSAGATTIGGNGTSFTSSYGGSGGGATGSNATGGSGGSTTVSGGAGTDNSNAGSGASATAPTLTSSLINTWYSNGMQTYLQGAGGGAGNSTNPWGDGGNGGYGIYIQANKLIAGTINTVGEAGGNSSYSPGGGGGGGSILLAYGSGGYTAGTYTQTGGATGTGAGIPSGAGGAGIAMTYSGQPIAIPDFSYTTNSNSIRNRNSSYQYSPSTTTSTSATTVISQSLTPQTSGLLAIRVLAIIYNNTIGDGVNLLLYNGTTLLDNNSYTQEGLASNPHLTALYYEATYTTGTAQTFSVQFEAVTGGTATCEIQEFTIEEIY